MPLPPLCEAPPSFPSFSTEKKSTGIGRCGADSPSDRALLPIISPLPSYEIAALPVGGAERDASVVEVVREAERLFYRAFSFEGDQAMVQDEAKRQMLLTFLETKAKQGIDHPQLTLLARRASPQLDPREHALIERYQHATTTAEKQRIFGEIMERNEALWRETMQNYDAWSEPQAPIAAAALYFVLEGLGKLEDIGVNDVEIVMADGLLSQVDGPYMDLLRQGSQYLTGDQEVEKHKLQVVANILRYQKAIEKGDRGRVGEIKTALLAERETLLALLLDAETAWGRSIPGSPQRREAFLRFNVLGDATMSLGISQRTMERVNHCELNFPGVSYDDYLAPIDQLSRALETPEKIDDVAALTVFSPQLQSLQKATLAARQRYLRGPNMLGVQQQYNSLQALWSHSCQMVSNFPEISSGWCQPPDVALRSITLETIRQTGGDEVPPQAIPEELKTLLMSIEVPKDLKMYAGKMGAYSYLNLVEDAVRSISFTPQIQSSDAVVRYVGVEEGGHAVPQLRGIWIQTEIDPSLTDRLRNILIADALIHEAVHVMTYWRQGQQGTRVPSTLDERHAYLADGRFLEGCLKQHWEGLSAEEREMLANFVLQHRHLGISINPFLALLPEAQDLSQLPVLAEGREVGGVSVYPIHFPVPYQPILEKLLVVDSGDKTELERFYQDVLDGKVEIEGLTGISFSAPKANIDFQLFKRHPEAFHVEETPDGMLNVLILKPLTGDEVKSLEDGLSLSQGGTEMAEAFIQQSQQIGRVLKGRGLFAEWERFSSPLRHAVGVASDSDLRIVLTNLSTQQAEQYAPRAQAFSNAFTQEVAGLPPDQIQEVRRMLGILLNPRNDIDVVKWLLYTAPESLGERLRSERSEEKSIDPVLLGKATALARVALAGAKRMRDVQRTLDLISQAGWVTFRLDREALQEILTSFEVRAILKAAQPSQ